jgi:aryl-alcohol dehydrogenase-like predicted oxidoreductase
METRKIGSLQVSVAGLGCNNFGRRLDAEGTATVVNAALEAGVTFFDTAEMYGAGKSEEFLGLALGKRRNDVIIATKFGHHMSGPESGGSPAYIQQAVEASLHRLGTDRIDLYQFHQPDPTTPLDETLGALAGLVRAGKVREIGCSNFTAEQLREAEDVAQGHGVRFVSVQNQYNMLRRDAEQEILPECERQGLAFLPYTPLANGLLTGKFRAGKPVPQGTRIADPGDRASQVLTERNLALVEDLIKFAQARDRSQLDLAVSWLLSRPVVASVFAGATKPEQVRANVAAAGWHLTPTELEEIDSILAQPVTQA